MTSTTTHTVDGRFLILHALVVKGLADEAALVEVTGLAHDVVAREITRLLGAELIRQRTGRLGGYAILQAGKDEHAELLALDVGEHQPALAQTYEAFLPLNRTLKALCTDWQLRPIAGSSEPNDHTDAEYDAAVVARLLELHDKAQGMLEPAVSALARWRRYPERLANALSRLRDGDVAAFAKPMSASYHDVWMELHQDLLTSLGRARDERDE